MSSSVRPPVPQVTPGAAEAAARQPQGPAEPATPSTAGTSPTAYVAPSTTCMLLIGDRVVLRADAPPEAEYILFELGEIELRSSEPGRVREHGYLTTVGRARARLELNGVSAAMAHECANAMHPVLSAAYARGPAARRVAPHLGALEVFQADYYEAASHSYRGVFIDLPTLGTDLDMPSAGIALQALHLAMLLDGEADETTVFLSTDAWTKLRKPGERTHRRPNISAVRDLWASLGELANRDPHPIVHGELPRADVIAFVRARAEAAPDDDGRAFYASLENSLAVRDAPERGPLADPTIWAIETGIDAGEFEGIFEAIDDVERSHGRTPGTTYLRARASLALRLEPPKLVAERVSALALSMTSFQELSLLAAEAWLDAGDPRRAVPYARAVLDAPCHDEGLSRRAKRLLERATFAAPATHQTFADSIAAAPMPASQPPDATEPYARRSVPPISMPDPNTPRSWLPQRSRVPTYRLEPIDMPAPMGATIPPPAPTVPPPEALAPHPALRPTRSRPVSSRPPPTPPRNGSPHNDGPTAPPPPLDLDLDLAPAVDLAASFTLELPGPESLPKQPDAVIRAPNIVSGAEGGATPSRAPIWRRSVMGMGVVQLESRAPPGFDPRAEPESDEPAPVVIPPHRASNAYGSTRESRANKETLSAEDVEGAGRNARVASLPPPPPLVPRHDSGAHARPTPLRPPSRRPPPIRASMETPVLGVDLPSSSTEEIARALERERIIRRSSGHRASSAEIAEIAMHGASLPPFRLENPPPMLAKAPLLPKLGGADELAEHLLLPPGLDIETRSRTALPKSVLDARVTFTVLARELGLDYRLKRGIELRADVSGIEAMQSVLLESFPERSIRTPEDAYELRRHGALLSEILARHLDAEWVDISPNEIGYWSMIVPPDTRIWPFGRVARLIELGHRERDLVSYFFELQNKARGR